MENLELFLTRRSTRAYKDTPVEQEKLDQILLAGRHAPSGGNNQTTHLLVIRDPRFLAELASVVKAEFAKMEVTPGMYKSMAASIRASKGEKYIFHYNAPVLIAAANRADYSNNIADCACVLENMMLMANALDLGSCSNGSMKTRRSPRSCARAALPKASASTARSASAIPTRRTACPCAKPCRAPAIR